MIDFSTAKPREVEGYLREQIRKAHGDVVENSSTVTASRGYYTVSLMLAMHKVVEFRNFRKKDAKQIVKAIRALS